MVDCGPTTHHKQNYHRTLLDTPQPLHYTFLLDLSSHSPNGNLNEWNTTERFPGLEIPALKHSGYCFILYARRGGARCIIENQFDCWTIWKQICLSGCIARQGSLDCLMVWLSDQNVRKIHSLLFWFGWYGDMEEAVAVIPLAGLVSSYQLSISAQYDK